MKKYLVAGHTIEYRKVGLYEPACIVLHRLGSVDRGVFTSAEARELARLLVEAADRAEEA